MPKYSVVAGGRRVRQPTDRSGREPGDDKLPSPPFPLPARRSGSPTRQEGTTPFKL